jgi:hypothetical protein
VRVKTRARVRGGGEGVRLRARGVGGVVLRADGTREGEGRLSEGLEGDAGLEATTIVRTTTTYLLLIYY